MVDAELNPAGYMLEARVAVKFLDWPIINVDSFNDFGKCVHRRVTTPDKLFSLDWCPIDKVWTKAVGWPMLSRDPMAAQTVAVRLMEQGVLEPTDVRTPHELCLMALEQTLKAN